MTTLGEFTLKRIDDDWQEWELWHGGRKLMTVDQPIAKGIMLRKYDTAALARGELRKATDKQDISEQVEV